MGWGSRGRGAGSEAGAEIKVRQGLDDREAVSKVETEGRGAGEDACVGLRR